MGYLPSTGSAQTDAFGAWVTLDYPGPDGASRQAQGELIAVNRDSIWLKDEAAGLVLPTRAVTSARLVWYRTGATEVGLLTVLGIVSTVSNGVFLVFTAPAWLIIGGVAAAGQSRISREQVIPGDWAEVRKFARFPQGLPAGVELRSLREKPRSSP
jgi:hypothetical protein